MEACLHFRGAALNASEAGISRATKDDGPLRTAVAKAIIVPLWGYEGHMKYVVLTIVILFA